MNQKVPYLTRQIVYSFLVGLILGGALIGFFDAYAKKPLFSSAYIRPGTYIQGVNEGTCREEDPDCVSPNMLCTLTGGAWINHSCVGDPNSGSQQ